MKLRKLFTFAEDAPLDEDDDEFHFDGSPPRGCPAGGRV
jgi:hypothetical protein